MFLGGGGGDFSCAAKFLIRIGSGFKFSSSSRPILAKLKNCCEPGISPAILIPASNMAPCDSCCPICSPVLSIPSPLATFWLGIRLAADMALWSSCPCFAAFLAWTSVESTPMAWLIVCPPGIKGRAFKKMLLADEVCSVAGTRAMYLPWVLPLFMVQGSFWRMSGLPSTKILLAPLMGLTSFPTVPDFTPPPMPEASPWHVGCEVWLKR